MSVLGDTEFGAIHVLISCPEAMSCTLSKLLSVIEQTGSIRPESVRSVMHHEGVQRDSESSQVV
jgi:hypothetical protein